MKQLWLTVTLKLFQLTTTHLIVLFFEPITLEDVLRNRYALKSRKGVIVQYGGQTPLKLARAA